MLCGSSCMLPAFSSESKTQQMYQQQRLYRQGRKADSSGPNGPQPYASICCRSKEGQLVACKVQPRQAAALHIHMRLAYPTENQTARHKGSALGVDSCLPVAKPAPTGVDPSEMPCSRHYHDKDSFVWVVDCNLFKICFMLLHAGLQRKPTLKAVLQKRSDL